MTDADEMKALLTYANYAKVGRALGVSKTIVAEWAKGEKVNPHRLQQVRDLIRPPAASEGPPSWVKRLLAGVMALPKRPAPRVIIDPEQVAAYVDRAEALVRIAGGPIMRLTPLSRRRLLAWAVLEELRRGGQPPVPEPSPARRR